MFFVTPSTIFCYIILILLTFEIAVLHICSCALCAAKAVSPVRPVTDVSQLRTLAAATGSGQQAGGGVSSASADPWSTTHRTHQPSEAGQIYLHLDTRLIRTPQASYTSTCLRICNPVTLGYSIVSAQQHRA